MDTNKLFMGLLTAGVFAWSSMIAAEMFVEPEKLEKNSYPIEVSEPVPATGAAAADSGTAEDIKPLLASADLANGEKQSHVCTSCHTFEKGGPSKVGPNLWGVEGGPHAHMPGFAYSSAMQGQKGEWTFEALNVFIYGPAQAVPGTKMTYTGLKKTKDRADLLAWLNTQSDKPLPLPAAAAAPTTSGAPPGPAQGGSPAPSPAGAPSTTAPAAPGAAQPSAPPPGTEPKGKPGTAPSPVAPSPQNRDENGRQGL